MLNLINVQGRNREGREVSSIFFACGGFGALKGIDGAPTTPSPSNMTSIPHRGLGTADQHDGPRQAAAAGQRRAG